ncbi:unnamed protein product [Gongylonema pulchrum]|uniref:Ovule protein n=1 Tax=Gongylonema pulchrum TaxID=637853 RepID=A0A183F0H2_9BILA|nr:unnamed protein product [Gongylonema pulchrum]
MKSRLADAKTDAELHMSKSTAGNKLKQKRLRPAKSRSESKKRELSMKKSESTANLIPSDPNTQTSLTNNPSVESGCARFIQYQCAKSNDVRMRIVITDEN